MPGTWLAHARDLILSRRDTVSAGFGREETKFPQSPLVGPLLTDYRLNGGTESLQTVSEALGAMAFGGIHDHLGGGMHRYSTEPTWSVPHFEKMLYDNAQLLELYADLYAITRQPLAREMAYDVAGYLARRMAAPEGGFYTAEDADVGGKEGETYLWTKAEITAALGAADADRFFALYAITPLPGEPNGPGVLRIRQDQTASDKTRAEALHRLTDLAPLRAKLLEIRDGRPQPARDDKIGVGLNGLAIAGLARAGTVFAEPSWIESAKRAAEFLWQQAYDEKTGRLRRYLYQGEARGDAFLDDYALLGLGFVALGGATGDTIWSSRAAMLASAMTARFIKPEGAVVTAAADPNLGAPAVDLQDYDTPSGTSAAYALLARLGKIEPRFADTATKIMAWIVPNLDAAPDSWASFTGSAAALGTAVQESSELADLDSAAHVKATAHHEHTADHDQIIITLTIDSGYHVNANPASADYLIPTTVKVPGTESAKVAYPQGQIFKPKFLADGIAVYEGSVPLKIELPAGGLAAADADKRRGASLQSANVPTAGDDLGAPGCVLIERALHR